MAMREDSWIGRQWERFKSEVGSMLRTEASYGLNDIRQKLFEEGWFGRATTPRTVRHVDNTYGIEPIRPGEGKAEPHQGLGIDRNHAQTHEQDRDIKR
jgi:hypothetical protein